MPIKPTSIILPLNALDIARQLAATLQESAADALWGMVELKRYALANLREDLAPSSQGYFPQDVGPTVVAQLWQWKGKPAELMLALEQARVLGKDAQGGWRVAGLDAYDMDWAKTLKERVRKQDWRTRQGRVTLEREPGSMAPSFEAVPPPRRIVASRLQRRKGVVTTGASKKVKKATAAKTSKTKAKKGAAKKKSAKASEA